MMQKTSRAFLGALALACAAATAGAQEIPIGVARVDITPEGPIRLSGYIARNGETQGGVEQKIWAKALAIGSDEQGPAVLVSVDSIGVHDGITSELAARLKKQVGLPRERLALGSSHSHSTPCLAGNLPALFGKPIPPDQQERIDRYTRDLVDKLEKVCLEALAARKPGKLSWSQGKVGFAANRRTAGGPVDHSLPALKVTDPDGKLRAVVANYACHCTTLDPADNVVSGDWAGYAQAAIEADHPGCIALTLIGCGADANPSGRGTPKVASDHGRALADEFNRLLHGPWEELPSPPAAAYERIALPFDTLPSRDDLKKLIAAGGPPGYNASLQLAKLDRGEPLAAELPYSTQAWKFGDKLLMTFLPGEVVVDYSLRIKKEFDPKRTWVTAYANDVPCYVPSERILREGGYEGGGAMVYYAWPTRLKPGVEQLILDSVHRVVGPAFANPDPKAGEPEAFNGEGDPPPRSPAESLRSFRTRPGLKLELVAAEPLVQSPVAIDFGADGRLWVCEMRDYPLGMDNQGKPGGAIKVLEDRDRDGKYETATVFADGLPFPTGVTAWRKGALICAAPEIIYAEDTNGDGKADTRKVLFKGFSTENFQARVNGLMYGLDNWVYGANGLIGGTIRGMADGREIDIGGRDFRMKPDTGEFEPASGLTQQGRVRDDWGNQFGGNNSILIQHYPLPDHYARRNPRVAAPHPSVSLARDEDPSRLFPASRTLLRYNEPESANRVTSACSPLIYRDDLLGPEYAGNAFTCETVHNLVRRLVLEPDGATFAGRRAADERDSEFLASTDSWTRPVQVRTGPDGAIWVVDMYRFVIEHPRWISPDRLATLDVRAGADMGRIYRLVPEGQPLRPVPNLDALPTRELAAALDSPNGTLRDIAHRTLAHRNDPEAAPVLAGLARSGKHPEARAQALGALDALGRLETAHLLPALGDGHPGVRREAVRLSESRLDREPALGEAVRQLADDPEAAVRFQVALSLGDSGAPESGRALAKVAIRDNRDRWIRAAVISSLSPHAGIVLEELIAKSGPQGPPASLVEPLIATVAGSGDREGASRALAAILGDDSSATAAPWRIAALAQFFDATRDIPPADEPRAKRLIGSARALVADPAADAPLRITALRLLGRIPGDLDADRAAIADRIDPAEPIEVQLAAIRSLARLGDAGSVDAAVSRWSRLGPSARGGALDALLARPESAGLLLDALEAGRIDPAQVDASHREQLLTRGPDEHRKRSEAIFGAQAIGTRGAVLTAYGSAKAMPGDAARGKKAFEKTCAACHKFGGVGKEVGPDLAALTDTSPEALFDAILDPNREVDARYASYTAVLNDGRVLTGLIAAETASAITLKRQEGQSDEVLRADLEELTTSGRSLMPEGLENDLKPADLADIIAHLRGGMAGPKTLAGNRPETVAPDGEGAIRLTAASAEVYGPSLTFEPEYGNLGYWHSPSDHAAWTFRVDRPTTFTASLEWACDDASAGNAYLIRIGDSVIRNTTPGTGAWSSYRSLFLRELTLPAGTHRLEMRPAGAIRGALSDVRAIVLTPRGAGLPAPPAPPAPAAAKPERGGSAEELAKAILDPKAPGAEREAIIRDHPELSAELIAAMAGGLGPDSAEEYRRIPWIWRVAIAAGRRGDPAEMRSVLAASLPEADKPLEDWQAVVIGGGIINGITLAGSWPGERLAPILADDKALAARWHRALDLASAMVDDEKVPTGTRYDALRMIGLEPWDKRGAQLARYLAEGTNPELHQGAICALGDLPSPEVPAALIANLKHFSPSNRNWAIEALVRDEGRRAALLDAIEAGKIAAADVGEDARKALLDPERNKSHERAKALLAR